MNRRDVLKSLPLLAAGVALRSEDRVAPPQARRIPLGIQYGGPRATPDANKAAMEGFKQLGYDLIEPVNMRGFDPSLFRRQAEEAGVRVRSIHITTAATAAAAPNPNRGGAGAAAGATPPGGREGGAPPAAGGAGGRGALQAPIPGGMGRRRNQNVLDQQDATYTPEGILAIVRAQAPILRDLGVEYGVLGASAISSYKSIDAIRRMADAHNQAHAVLMQVGVKLSYHSHEFDFWPVEGRTGFDVLIENTDPAILYQVDIGWAVVGGADAVALINKHANRLGLFHMRDFKDDNVTTAGEGTLDWSAIFAAISRIKDPLCYVEGGDPAVASTNLQRYGWGMRRATAPEDGSWR